MIEIFFFWLIKGVFDVKLCEEFIKGGPKALQCLLFGILGVFYKKRGMRFFWENSQNLKIPIVAIIFTMPMLFPHLVYKTILPASFSWISFNLGPPTTLQLKCFRDDSLLNIEKRGKMSKNYEKFIEKKSFVFLFAYFLSNAHLVSQTLFH